jgi:uncharacterized protein YjlB
LKLVDWISLLGCYLGHRGWSTSWLDKMLKYHHQKKLKFSHQEEHVSVLMIFLQRRKEGKSEHQ